MHMRIDTGADRTVFDANLVEETENLVRNVTLEGFNGFNASQSLAKVWNEVGKHRLHHIVAVVDNASEKILLGMDTGIMRYLLELEVQQMQAKEELKLANSKVHELTIITRDQAACQAAEEQVDTELSAESGAMPFQFSDEMFWDEEAGEVDIPATKDGEPIDIPIPELQEEASDKLRLSSQQEEDSTLARIRQLAKDGKDGYSWKDKVLVHRLDDTMSERVVVPKKWRKGILKMALSNKLGSHFSYKKTVATMARLFTSPGISKDTKAWCRSCPECQKAAKKTSHLAPLCPLPVFSTPFSRMAFDLEGPLPKSKSDNRYIYLHICVLHLNTLRQWHYAG